MEGSPAKWRVSCGNSAGIVISRHFRVAIVCKTIAKFGAFAQIFHGHFCQLAEIHGILESCGKRSVLPCKGSPHCPTLGGNCLPKIERYM